MVFVFFLDVFHLSFFSFYIGVVSCKDVSFKLCVSCKDVLFFCASF